MSSGEWQHGLFGCFDNCGVCVLSYLIPCYQFGRNAEALGESCCVCGILFLVPFVDLVAAVKLRGQIREQRGISGGLIGDLCTWFFCPFCTLAQEAQELADSGAAPMAIERE